jgi:hypothetical protein
MADDFVLNSLLSVFLDDYHEIPSDLDASSLSQKDIDLHINRIHPLHSFPLSSIAPHLLTNRNRGFDR